MTAIPVGTKKKKKVKSGEEKSTDLGSSNVLGIKVLRGQHASLPII